MNAFKKLDSFYDNEWFTLNMDEPGIIEYQSISPCSVLSFSGTVVPRTAQRLLFTRFFLTSRRWYTRVPTECFVVILHTCIITYTIIL